MSNIIDRDRPYNHNAYRASRIASMTGTTVLFDSMQLQRDALQVPLPAQLSLPNDSDGIYLTSGMANLIGGVNNYQMFMPSGNAGVRSGIYGDPTGFPNYSCSSLPGTIGAFQGGQVVSLEWNPAGQTLDVGADRNHAATIRLAERNYPFYFEMYLHVSATIPSATLTRIPFDTAFADPSGGVTTGPAAHYTFPVGGLWILAVAVNNVATSTGVVWVELHKNTTPQDRAAYGTAGVFTNDCGSSEITLMEVAAQDTVSAWAYAPSGATTGTQQNVWMCGINVGSQFRFGT